MACGPGESNICRKRRTTIARLFEGLRKLTFGEVVDLWRADETFADWFLDILPPPSGRPFFWEMPPVTAATLDRPYEYALVDAPALEGTEADPSAFLDELDEAGPGDVVRFANLRGDATLVVPAPVAGRRGYGPIVDFLAFAPTEQRRQLLRTLSATMTGRLAERTAPVWVSTAGLGVPWLHVRLDDRPKYYRHEPYRSATA